MALRVSFQKQMMVFTPISVAPAHKAEPRKDPVSLCAVKLTKTFNTTNSVSDGASPSLIVFPQTLLKVTSQSKCPDGATSQILTSLTELTV